jgi:hypothetical protein
MEVGWERILPDIQRFETITSVFSHSSFLQHHITCLATLLSSCSRYFLSAILCAMIHNYSAQWKVEIMKVELHTTPAHRAFTAAKVLAHYCWCNYGSLQRHSEQQRWVSHGKLWQKREREREKSLSRSSWRDANHLHLHASLRIMHLGLKSTIHRAVLFLRALSAASSRWCQFADNQTRAAATAHTFHDD